MFLVTLRLIKLLDQNQVVQLIAGLLKSSANMFNTVAQAHWNDVYNSGDVSEAKHTDCLVINYAIYDDCIPLVSSTTKRKGRLKMREWKMRYGQNCKGGKCRIGKSGSRSQGWKIQE